jgi:signal transduction histidine kinase
MKSIGRQLGGGLVMVMLVAVALVGQGSVWLFDKALRGYLADVLQRETDGLLAALEQGPSGLYLDQSRVDPDYRRPFSGRYFVIETGERWRSRSLWDQRLPLEGIGLRNDLVEGPGDQLLLTLSGRYEVHSQPVRIAVAMDYRPLLAALDQARWWIWGLGLMAIGASVVLQQLLLRRALRPLHRAQAQLAEWQKGVRGALDESVPLELRPLVQEINQLGLRIERLLKRSRTGLGDLGHALKTPLAVLESSLQHQSPPDAQSVVVMRSQIAAMRAQLERALQRARLAPERQNGERFQPSSDLPWLLASLQEAHAHRVDITHQGDMVTAWPFDREDMIELLGNLLDNACKWGRHSASLNWTMDDTGLRVVVEDDGAGLSEAARSAVLNRGVRLDESTPGHGLGLGIVSDLVEAYEGRLDLGESVLGGLRVEVQLPNVNASIGRDS